jgi:tetratricopeptide (TPR) repeat protein
MKADHRHELQTNELAAWLENAVDKTKPYARAIVGVCVAIAIIVLVYWYVGALQRRNTTAAAEQLISAIQFGTTTDLQALADQHRGTQPAALAQLLLAERLLDQGTDELYNDKPAGRENLLKASDAFQSAEQTVRDPMLRTWALYGVGRAHEAMGDLDRARGDYERMLKEYPDSSLTEPARAHLARLNSMGTKEFYDWFAKQDPRPPAPEKEPGTPGQKPLFDFSDPTMPSDLKLPSALNPSQPGATATPSGEKSSSETPAESGTESQKPDAAPPAGEKSEAAPPESSKPADAPSGASK